MKSNSNQNKLIESENMSAGRPITNQSLPESVKINTPENKKDIKRKENIIRM